MNRLKRAATAAMLVLSMASLATGADARRGGSFGSRGSRTYSAPRATYGNAGVSAVQRSTTPRTASAGYGSGYGNQSGYRGYNQGYSQSRPYYPSRPRFGFGSGLVGGLIAGGLLGHLLGGHGGGGWGAGGGGGFLASIIQLLILGGIVWLAISFFRRRKDGDGGSGFGGTSSTGSYAPPPQPNSWTPAAASVQQENTDVEITPADRAAFERLLNDIQAAYSREDQSRLHSLCTGEIVTYFAEEIAENKANGVRNDVSAIHLLDAEVSEAWAENGVDYATVSLRYDSIDVMRDRTTGAIASGDPTPSQTIEYWTFRRDATGAWKLSAIQDS